METTTDTKSTVTLSCRANSQVQNTLFQLSRHHSLCIFTTDEQEPACHAHSNLHQQRCPTVTTAEMHHSPPHCAHIHCLVSINVQQTSVNVNRCCFFHMKDFSVTHSLDTCFCVRNHSVRLPLCCHLSSGNKM